MRQNSASTNQMALPGLEQFLCECGCGTYSMRSTRGMKRRYLNDTHKKRVARRRASALRTEGTVSITPKGYLYLYSLDNREIEALWAEFSTRQRAVVQLICDTGMHPPDVLETLCDLFDLGIK